MSEELTGPERALFAYLVAGARWAQDYANNNPDSVPEIGNLVDVGLHLQEVLDGKTYVMSDYGAGYVDARPTQSVRDFVTFRQAVSSREAGQASVFRDVLLDAINSAEVVKPSEVDDAKQLRIFHWQENTVEEQADSEELAALVLACGSFDSACRVAAALDRDADGIGWQAPRDVVTRRQQDAARLTGSPRRLREDTQAEANEHAEEDFRALVDNVRRGWGALIYVPVYGFGWDFVIDIPQLKANVEDACR